MSATLAGGSVTTLYPNLNTVSDVEVPTFTSVYVGTFDINRTLGIVPLTVTERERVRLEAFTLRKCERCRRV